MNQIKIKNLGPGLKCRMINAETGLPIRKVKGWAGASASKVNYMLSKGGYEIYVPNPKSNELIYTTTNGQILSLSSFNEVPATSSLVSNILQVNEFIMTFNVPIERLRGSFRNSTRLKTIYVPSTVNKIDGAAFYGCSNLVKISLSDNIEVLGGSVFERCRSLSEIILPSKLTTLGSYCFLETNLKEVDIPANVTSIQLGTFKECLNLSKVVVRSLVPPIIGTEVFDYNKSNRKIYVPAESLDIYKAATNWRKYASYILPIEN